MAAVDEVVNWFTTASDNPSPIPPGPDGKRPRRVGLSLQEMMASIARYRDTLSGVTGTILLSGTDPRLSWNETDGTADNKYWDILPVAEQLRMRAVNDAQNVFTDWLRVDRTGTTIDLIDFRATTVRATGVLDVTGDITVAGSVDGRDVDADGTKLDTIETNAKDDQTAAEIEAIVDHDNLVGFVVGEHFLENSIDHTAILNIGSNTHAQIDTHIGDGTIHFTEASITITLSQVSDSGALAALATVDTAEIDDEAVTLAKMAHIDTARILGRVTAATGDVESLTGTQTTTLIDEFTDALKGLAPLSGGGTTNFLRADGTWTVPAGSGGNVSNTGTPVNDQVAVWTDTTTIEGTTGLTYNGTALSITGNITLTGTVDGRDVDSDGTKLDTIETNAKDDQTAGEIEAIVSHDNLVDFLTGEHFLQSAISITLSQVSDSGALAALATVGTTQIDNDAVTFAKMQNIPTANIIGRVTGGTGDPEDLTSTQATTLINNFTSTLKGLAPLSGGGTTNFLRADGTWTAPSGSGGNVSNTGTPVNNQLAVWTDATTIEGTTGLTYDGTDLNITGNITLTGTVDGIDIATDVAANTAKVTNATHTQDVTGSGVLIIQPVAISNKATLAVGMEGLDQLLVHDISAGLLKKITIRDFIPAQEALTSGLTGTDELMVSDGGLAKRMDISVMNAYFDANLNFGSGNVSNVSTPLNNQIAVWTTATTIEGDANLTWNGSLLTVAGALTVTGAFTSLGIDDNATVENFQLSNNNARWGVAGSQFNNFHLATDQSIILSGGNTASSGGNIQVFGAGHSGQPGDIAFKSSTSTWMLWDESVGQLLISTDVGAKTLALTISPTQLATFAGAVTVQGAFTSLGIDDNASGERLQLSDTGMLMGNGNFFIGNRANNNFMQYLGGNAGAVGGGMLVYGGAHVSQASDVSLRANTNNFLYWDESDGELEIFTGSGSKTSALTIDASQRMNFEGYSEDADSYTVGAGTRTLNTTLATYFYAVSAMTAVALTFAFTNPIGTGRVTSIMVEMNNAAGLTGGAPTWPSSVDWGSNGTEPTWTSGIDVVAFWTRDGGTTWHGSAATLDSA